MYIYIYVYDIVYSMCKLYIDYRTHKTEHILNPNTGKSLSETSGSFPRAYNNWISCLDVDASGDWLVFYFYCFLFFLFCYCVVVCVFSPLIVLLLEKIIHLIFFLIILPGGKQFSTKKKIPPRTRNWDFVFSAPLE